MEKYYITAVRYNGGHISEVLVHQHTENNRLTKGVVWSKGRVVRHINNEIGSFDTAIYDYSFGNWQPGAEVGTVKINGVYYLRTDRDSTEMDNLGNLLLIDEINE